jgi:hypothetical protein
MFIQCSFFVILFCSNKHNYVIYIYILNVQTLIIKHINIYNKLEML